MTKYLTLSTSNSSINPVLGQGKKEFRNRFAQVLMRLQKFNYFTKGSDLINGNLLTINSNIYTKNGKYDEAMWAYRRDQIISRLADANMIKDFHYRIVEFEGTSRIKKLEYIFDGYNPILTDDFYTIKTIEYDHNTGSVYSSGDVMINNTIVGTYSVPIGNEKVDIKLYPQYDNNEALIKVKKGVVKFLVEKGYSFSQTILSENEINEYALNYQNDNESNYPNIEDRQPRDKEILDLINVALGLDATDAFYAAKPSIEFIKEKIERINPEEVFDAKGNKLC